MRPLLVLVVSHSGSSKIRLLSIHLHPVGHSPHHRILIEHGSAVGSHGSQQLLLLVLLCAGLLLILLATAISFSYGLTWAYLIEADVLVDVGVHVLRLIPLRRHNIPEETKPLV